MLDFERAQQIRRHSRWVGDGGKACWKRQVAGAETLMEKLG
jgi:hypothetical protein